MGSRTTHQNSNRNDGNKPWLLLLLGGVARVLRWLFDSLSSLIFLPFAGLFNLAYYLGKRQAQHQHLCCVLISCSEGVTDPETTTTTTTTTTNNAVTSHQSNFLTVVYGLSWFGCSIASLLRWIYSSICLGSYYKFVRTLAGWSYQLAIDLDDSPIVAAVVSVFVALLIIGMLSRATKVHYNSGMIIDAIYLLSTT